VGGDAGLATSVGMLGVFAGVGTALSSCWVALGAMGGEDVSGGTHSKNES